MGLAKDVRGDFDRGRSDARRAMQSRRISASVAMKLRLSLFWPAGLAMVMAGLAAWRFARLSIPLTLAVATAAGLVTLAVFGLLLEVLLKRARLAESPLAENKAQPPAGPAQAA